MDRATFREGEIVQAEEFNEQLSRHNLKFQMLPSSTFGEFQAIITGNGYIYHSTQRFMSNDITITKVEEANNG